MSEMKKFVWYSDDLLEALNGLGFVHFRAKVSVKTGFYQKGKAFYFDEEKKEYGLCDVISYDYKDCDKNKADIINRYKEPAK